MDRAVSCASPMRRRSGPRSRRLPRTVNSRRGSVPPVWRARERSPGTASWSDCLADPATVSVVIPALNEEEAIGDVVAQLRAAAPWREIIVVDDGSSDATGAHAERAGARVIRHPYTKGNGAAVKTGIRHAQGEFVLIVDAEGRHRPSSACRIVGPL